MCGSCHSVGSHFKVHQQICIGQPPYCSDVCNKSFRIYDRRHLQVHGGDIYGCVMCVISGLGNMDLWTAICCVESKQVHYSECEYFKNMNYCWASCIELLLLFVSNNNECQRKTVTVINVDEWSFEICILLRFNAEEIDPLLLKVAVI
jgi:hypothetical protein